MMFVWTVSDLIGVTLTVAAILIALSGTLRKAIRQRNCKHIEYRETMACDAICTKCGKNLGFIGNVRKAKADGSQP